MYCEICGLQSKEQNDKQGIIHDYVNFNSTIEYFLKDTGMTYWCEEMKKL